MTTATLPPLTIQQMAARSGFSEYTLRYYEDIGLIGPISRDNSSRHRRYSPNAVDKIEALACLRATGMSIDEMRAYLAGIEQGHAAATDMVELFSDHAARLEREMTALQLRLEYVQAKAELWQSRIDHDEPRELEAMAISRRLGDQLRGSTPA